METAIALIIFANSIQVTIFMLMLVCSTDKHATVAQLYVKAWKIIWKCSFAPFFEPQK